MFLPAVCDTWIVKIFKRLIFVNSSTIVIIFFCSKSDEEDVREQSGTSDQLHPRIIKHSPTQHVHTKPVEPINIPTQKLISIRVEKMQDSDNSNCHLSIPKVTASSSSETLTGKNIKNIIAIYIFLLHRYRTILVYFNF